MQTMAAAKSLVSGPPPCGSLSLLSSRSSHELPCLFSRKLRAGGDHHSSRLSLSTPGSPPLAVSRRTSGLAARCSTDAAEAAETVPIRTVGNIVTGDDLQTQIMLTHVTASTTRTANSHIPNYPSLPSQMMCQVHNVTLHADKDTDEIYAQMTLQHVNSENDVFPIPDFGLTKSKQPSEFFCKTLTTSDTSTHGGFSVSHRAAEKLFLDQTGILSDGVGAIFGAECDKRGMLVRVAGDNIMMSPPLIISPEEIDEITEMCRS